MVVAALLSCKKSSTQPAVPAGFAKTPQNIAITGGSIPEASGIADSKKNPGFLWVEEDSGNPALIYLLGHDGQKGKGIPLENATNRDWEDIALASGPEAGTDYIYLADIGDNNLAAETYLIYRFPEPSASADNISEYDALHFVYPDAPHNAEGFIVDPNTKDIYIFTKNDTKSKIFRLPFPQPTSGVDTAEYVADLPFTGVVSAAISATGDEIILKTYTTLYYYQRSSGEQIATALARTPTTLGYQLEAQGEAVCFANDNSGFYTLSEMRNNEPVTLNFYKRN